MYVLNTLAATDKVNAEVFEQIIGTVRPWFDALCDMLQVPDLNVTAVVADDFVGAVTGAIAKSSYIRRDQPFTVERLGGTVSAKNISMSEDWSEVHMVFDASFLNTEPTSAHTLARGAHYAAHEFAHGLIGRLRYVTGCAPARVVDRSQTPAKAARAVMLGALDEWRADRVANIVLSKLATVGTSETGLRGAGGPDVVGDSYIQHVGVVLDGIVYPGWPDAVRDYQEHKTDLIIMWNTVVTQAERVFILLAHAEAEAECLQVPAALAGPFIDHPGSALYLGQAWGNCVPPPPRVHCCRSATLSRPVKMRS
jgi:hypothetical protein